MAVLRRPSIFDPEARAETCDTYAAFYAERAASRARTRDALTELAARAGGLTGLPEERESDRASLVLACATCADAVLSLGAQETVVSEFSRALARVLREEPDGVAAMEASSDEAHDHHRRLAGQVMGELARVRSLAAAVGVDTDDVVFVLGAED